MSERKNSRNNSRVEDEHEENGVTNERAAEYMKSMLAEKLLLEKESVPIAVKLLDEEIAKTHSMGRIPAHAPRYVNVFKEKPTKVAVKVVVPVRQFPKFNFMGKLLGPKGNTLKRLQEDTQCRITILGKGSMKDRAKEEELRNSLDPKYGHLSEDLHVEVSALGPPAEAYSKMGYALAEIKKYLSPDKFDDIAQEQFREMESYGGEPGPGPKRPPPMSGGARPPLGGPRGPLPTPRLMPAKAKILSILDRARAAMEESYGLNDNYNSPPSKFYDSPRQNKYSPQYEDYDDDSFEPPSRSWKPMPGPGASGPTPRYKSSPYSRP